MPQLKKIALKENIPQLFADIFFSNLDRHFKVRDLDAAKQEILKAVLAEYFKEKPDEYWSELFAFVRTRKSWDLRDIARELSRKISLRLDLKNRSWEEVENIFKSKEVFEKCVRKPSAFLPELQPADPGKENDFKLNKERTNTKSGRAEKAKSKQEDVVGKTTEAGLKYWSSKKKTHTGKQLSDQSTTRRKKYLEEYGDKKQEIDRRKRKRRKRDMTEREEEEAARRAIELGLKVRRDDIWD
jgi:hypothetical protein